MMIDIGNAQDYASKLDTIVGFTGGTGTVNITLKTPVSESATFRMDKSNLYLTAYEAPSGIMVEFPVNYMDMKGTPSSISIDAIHGAISASKRWSAKEEGAEFGSNLKLLIFVISEAARFMPVRFAVKRALQQSHTFSYPDFHDVIKNWDHIKTKIVAHEGVAHNLLTVADVQKYLGQIKPAWDDSAQKKSLTDSHILF